MIKVQTDRRSFARLLVAVLAAIGLTWAASAVALADDFNCTTTVGAETKDNVVVPDNATCTLNGTMVEGTIYVETGATLVASGVKVDGNVQAEGAAAVTVHNNATVGGSIQIKQGGSATVANVKVNADIQFFTNKGQIIADGNDVGGNLQAETNTGGLSINNNVIDGNLQCKENNPPPTGSGNQAASLEDQCAGLGGAAPEPTTTSTPTATPTTTPRPTATPTPGDDDDDDELYGIVTNFPAGLIGTWTIGGMDFEATGDTEFDRNGYDFAAGVTVEVEYETEGNVRYAEEIEIVYGRQGNDDDDDDDGDDDDGDDDYGRSYGAEGQAYGRLDTKGSVPGTWVIGGIPYQVTERTELDDDDDDNDNDLVQGARVKVEYTVRSDGERVAHEIEDTDDDGDVSSDDHAKLVGFVQQMPSGGLVGAWRIAGLDFVASNDTEFERDHGAFAIGAYVEVEYYMDGSTRRIHEIETEVPPGAGDDDDMGKLQSKGTDGQVQAAAVNAAVWQINGTAYSVTPATQLVDNAAALEVGATVMVNSYQATDGSQVATRIEALNVTAAIYLPLLER